MGIRKIVTVLEPSDEYTLVPDESSTGTDTHEDDTSPPAQNPGPSDTSTGDPDGTKPEDDIDDQDEEPDDSDSGDTP